MLHLTLILNKKALKMWQSMVVKPSEGDKIKEE